MLNGYTQKSFISQCISSFSTLIRGRKIWEFLGCFAGLGLLSYLEYIPALSFSLPAILLVTGLNVFAEELQKILLEIFQKNDENYRNKYTSYLNGTNILFMSLYAVLAVGALYQGLPFLAAAAIFNGLSIAKNFVFQLPFIKSVYLSMPTFLQTITIVGLFAGVLALALYGGAPLPHPDIVSNTSLYLISIMSTTLINVPVRALHNSIKDSFFPQKPILYPRSVDPASKSADLGQQTGSINKKLKGQK